MFIVLDAAYIPQSINTYPLKRCVRIRDIQGTSQTSYTTPCNGVFSHGAQIGGIWDYADHTRRNKHKQNASTIFARRKAFHACFSSHSDRFTYAPEESRLFWSLEKPKYSQFELHARIKMAQVLGSPLYILVRMHTQRQQDRINITAKWRQYRN